MMTKKTTLENVLKMIQKWSKNNDTQFFGGFVSFDEKGDVKEDRLICYGLKKCLKISSDDLNKFFKKN